MTDKELFGNSEQLNDTISRAAVVDEIDGVDWYHQNQHGEMVHGANPDEHQAWYKAEDIYKAVGSVPSAQPTLYGYDLRSLIIFTDAVKKNGVAESELNDFATNAKAAWKYAWEEFQRTQKEALDSIMRGDHHANS